MWFTPLREALDSFVSKTQERVTGTVKLALYKGKFRRRPPVHFSLYSNDLSSFTMGDSYDQKDAKGFIRILGCRRAPGVSQQEAEGGRKVKMWSGRFREPLDAEFERGSGRITFDRRLLPQEVAASKATRPR